MSLHMRRRQDQSKNVRQSHVRFLKMTPEEPKVSVMA